MVDDVINGLPKRVVVGPFSFKLFGDAKNFTRLCKSNLTDEDEVKGLTDIVTNEITVSPDVGVSNRAETVLHEVLHATWYAAQLHRCVDVCDEEEEVVGRMSVMLLMVLRDNPELLAYLTRRP